MPPMPPCSVALASYSSNSSTVLLDNSNGRKIYVWRNTTTNYATADADCKSLASWPGDRSYLVSYNSYAEVGPCTTFVKAE